MPVSDELVEAVEEHDVESVARLLEPDADPNRISAGPSDGSPLCGAASWGYVDTVELLRAGGADPSLPEDAHATPLDWAAMGMHAEVARRLLAAGAHPDRGAGPRAPLITAIERGSIETVRVVLDHGADPRVTDADGRTALELARSRAGADVEHEVRTQIERCREDGRRLEIRREATTIEAALVDDDGDRVVVRRGTAQAAIVAALEAG